MSKTVSYFCLVCKFFEVNPSNWLRWCGSIPHTNAVYVQEWTQYSSICTHWNVGDRTETCSALKLTSSCFLTITLQAVQDYYQCWKERYICTSSTDTTLSCSEKTNFEAFDDSCMVLVSKSDIEGYELSLNPNVAYNTLTELSVACRVQLTSQAAIARLSCTWLRINGHKFWRKKLQSSIGNDQQSSIRFDLQVCWTITYMFM